MTNALVVGEAEFRLTFNSKMTFEFVAEIEKMMLDALRRYIHIEVDLSKVREIDICGVHLLGFLESFTDKGLVIIATSPVVEQAYERLHRPLCLDKAALAARGERRVTGAQQTRYPVRHIASRRTRNSQNLLG